MSMNPVEIARLEESRQAKSTAELADEAEPIAGGWMAYGGPDCWATQACGLGLAGPVSDDALDCLVQFYASRGVEPRIEVCPFVDRTLVHGLAKRGFRLVEFENVLARDLTDESLPKQIPQGWPEPLEIVPVDRANADLARAFIEVSTSGIRPLDQPIEQDLLEITRRMLDHPRTHAFLATWGGVPVGGGAMEAAGPITCLFSTSVLPDWQRRGIQTALILHRLEQARAAGSRLAVIHSSPDSPTEHNAIRLGFHVAYTKVIMVK